METAAEKALRISVIGGERGGLRIRGIYGRMYEGEKFENCRGGRYTDSIRRSR